MRATSAFVLATVAFAAEAHAVDHLMHVDEILLDGGGGEQYIEFHDAVDETFPNGPYRLEVYDTDAALIDTVTLSGIDGGTGVYYVVGNAAAVATYSSASFDVTLVNALPAVGQACFVRDNGQKVHCVAWGCNNTVLAGAQSAMAPASGMALARQSNSQLHYSIPSPAAANSAGTVAGACASTVDAGVTADAGGNPNNPDAGTGGGGDDGGGCCQTSTRSTPGAVVLCALVLGLVLRRRRR